LALPEAEALAAGQADALARAEAEAKENPDILMGLVCPDVERLKEDQARRKAEREAEAVAQAPNPPAVERLVMAAAESFWRSKEERESILAQERILLEERKTNER
jgi:hypothetical protein